MRRDGVPTEMALHLVSYAVILGVLEAEQLPIRVVVACLRRFLSERNDPRMATRKGDWFMLELGYDQHGQMVTIRGALGRLVEWGYIRSEKPRSYSPEICFLTASGRSLLKRYRTRVERHIKWPLVWLRPVDIKSVCLANRC